MMILKRVGRCLLIGLLMWGGGLWLTMPVMAAAPTTDSSFVIKSIQITGTERFPVATVKSYLPVHVGQKMTPQESTRIIQKLFATGFFDQIRVYRDGDALIINVHERSVINAVKFTGNQIVKSSQFKKILKQSGLYKGQVYEPDMLNTLKLQLLEQYYRMGHYNAVIHASVKSLPRNRVDIDLKIEEGKTAVVKQIAIVGNHAFSEDHLLSQLPMGQPSWWKFWSHRNKFSLQKLEKSIQVIKKDYMNSGYIDFALDSTQLGLTPNRHQMYVTLNIKEGHRYKVSGVHLSGHLLGYKAQLRPLLKIRKGEIFSRKKVMDTIKALQNFYGDKGYAFANVNPIPDVHKAKRTVGLTFYVDPGRRYYVREIHFFGNKSTQGNVLRREMRQLEGALYSRKNIHLSKLRIQRLPYIVHVKITPQRVPGSNNQVDLNVYIKERLSNSFTASIGYSQFEGAILSATVSSNNFLGTGNSLNVGVNTSLLSTLYNVSYMNPFFTVNGVSESYNLYYERTDTANTVIINYTSDRLGGSISFGIPLSNFDTINLGMGAEKMNVALGSTPSATVTDFLQQYGDNYQLMNLTLGYTHDTRNKTVFPTSGNDQNVNLYLVPIGTIHYYKLGYSNEQYFPITSWLTGALSGTLGYGNGFSGTNTLPFFDTYYAGGIGSVAGYQDNTLGPVDPVSGQPTGGNVEVVGQAELIWPVPFMTNSPNVRLSTFFDAGNIYRNLHDAKRTPLRTSVGVGFEWLSPIGPLTFSIAKALNPGPTDQTQMFQFNIGTYF